MLSCPYYVLFTCNPRDKNEESMCTISSLKEGKKVWKSIILDELYSVKMFKNTSIVLGIQSKNECSSFLHASLRNYILYDDESLI